MRRAFLAVIALCWSSFAHATEVLVCEASFERNLDHRKIREYRYSALHFKLDVRPPAVGRHEGAGAPGHRLSLQEETVSFLKNRWNPAAGEATRKAVIELAVRYLKEAEEAEALRN